MENMHTTVELHPSSVLGLRSSFEDLTLSQTKILKITQYQGG